MRPVIDYIKGTSGLLLVTFLLLLAILFFFVFNIAYAAAVAFIAIIAVLLIPYYFGRKNQPEEAGNYSLKKIK
ncbi:hypothetical protein HOD83_03930 [Candidatus Woesearchaeota archaeon]|jgi:hypothetical protein|nr:hypothetical protein [Candidatus Woesearchaeota archaeon]MBT4114247.1 hypothetical protein [Candidatus Woesearchaeota archaeon]MBT4248698.1 hypothetical protein [Candidatus Woesearchaeota archaeon]